MSEHHNKGKKFGRQFKPGQSGNPGGKPPGIMESRTMFAKERETFMGLMAKYADITLEELKRILIDPKSKTNQAVIARLYSKAIGGSFPHLTEILNRICGPVPKHVRLEDDTDNSALPSLRGYSADTLTAVMIKLKREAEAVECNPSQSQPSSESSGQSLPPGSRTVS